MQERVTWVWWVWWGTEGAIARGGRRAEGKGGGGGENFLVALSFFSARDSAATSDRDGLDIGLRLVGALWALQ